jgi:hypothetical protein
LLAFLAYGVLWAEDIPELKTKMGPPVIDELMGGCSLTCAFPWDAIPGDSGSSKISALNDSSSLTAWTSARVGDRLVFKFPANLPRELNGTPFYGVDIANGRIRPESGFKDLGRVKTIRLFHNNQPLYTIQLADTRRWQKASFPDVVSEHRRYAGARNPGDLSRKDGFHSGDHRSCPSRRPLILSDCQMPNSERPSRRLPDPGRLRPLSWRK